MNTSSDIITMVTTLVAYAVLWILTLISIGAASRLVFVQYFQEKKKFLQSLGAVADSKEVPLAGIQSHSGIQ